ncbi:MAG TPA: hypothetical protein VGQ31_14145 [Candidatus Limnocylindrales bacterium]|nr:hypothetical protein [Candidatus Limnocylindrales bacterium]
MTRRSSFETVAHTKRGVAFFATALFILSVAFQYASAVAPSEALAANPSASLDQCANDPAPSPATNGCATLPNGWENGNLGASKSIYFEGDSIPYRLTFGSLDTTSSHTVTIEWDTTKSSKHAIDYLTTWNRTVADANPCLGVVGCGSPDTFAIPADPQVTGAGVTPVAGDFTIFGGKITGVSAYSGGAAFPTGDNSRRITITFSADVPNPVLAWGGHIAARKDWGLLQSAVNIPGSPYHMRLIDLDGSGGNQDRSLSAAAVVFPGSITITKVANPEGSTSFPFTASPAPLSNFSLVDDGSSSDTKAFTGIVDFTTYTVTEGSVAGWDLQAIDCLGGGTPTIDLATATATIALEEGQNVACRFTNAATPAPALSIDKTSPTVDYDSVGDVITYAITATNTGNTTLAAVTITDPNAVLGTCTPANGSSLAPGATLTCAATHVVTQADLTAGHYLNQACVDDGAGGAASVCDSVDVPGVQTKTLSITKDDDTAGYDHVGQVITYTIVATNTGNVPQDITVSDTPALDAFSCTPANGTTVAPAGTMTCTGTHTVSQADLDAGNLHDVACADATGATQACAPDDVPGVQSPALSITKVADLATYNAVGQTITYTIVATNTGNVTLASATITDANATLGTCTPANGSALDPGATITCSATHQITQADIDAGHYLNTACVDDGEGGLAPVCADANVPAASDRGLSIVKDATETSYDAVGQTIHYSITATNTGNTTLASVTITDENAALGTCTPANGSTLAPTDTLTCVATHVVTQADIDAGHYLNTACVSATDATPTCDDADVPSVTTPALTIVKDATESSYGTVGDILHYSITATNSGNTTLAAATITDPNAILGTCTPANGSPLAPGATLTCVATHVVTQADITAGHYLNTACVDATGVAQACDSADVVSATLTIEKSNNAPLETVDLPDGSAELPTADEGSTVTYTLTYQVGTVDVDNGIITDVLPAGVTYVAGSASSNSEFTFSSYDAGSRTLTWEAASVSTGGSLTYAVKVDAGASILSQPLTNHATIDSDQTSPDTASSDVFVPAPPAAETHKPTPPPTDTLASTGPADPGSSMALILVALVALILGIGFVTPAPAAVRRRNRR